MTHWWRNSEDVIMSRVFECVPGVRCELCSTGLLRIEGNKLSSSGVYHPAGRQCHGVAQAALSSA